MLTVFTEGGEKAKEENDQTKARANHSTAIETTIEIEHPSATSPTKEKGKADKKAKDEAQVEAGTDRTLKPVATAAFLDTMPETVEGDRTMRKRSKRKHQTKDAKKQETTSRSWMNSTCNLRSMSPM
jgi:hypothetical protein